ncbi:nuclear speckle splicing regulatory protein 1-like [Homarus americanus]|uniref:nuclear speckle splicing regulatory protein 1-like n=1 Tax=Homarus americanus TaxID=6706 RepID=UPI001C46606B|nr:nuclear speckle splicing regulatory protein 1-like [Homarus americanus]
MTTSRSLMSSLSIPNGFSAQGASSSKRIEFILASLIVRRDDIRTEWDSQKKIIQISPKCTAVPVGGSLGQKVTVVKSADGRILVKSSETLNKDVNKPVTTVSVPTPTKSVLVSATKQVIVPSNLANKEGEGKKDMAVSSKKDDSTSAKNTPSKDSKKLSDSGAVPILNKPTSVEKKKPDPVEVRNNIKKTLADCLVKRYQDAKKEFDSLSEDAIKDLAVEIEKELYTFFGKDVGFKYKSRYRSILFNTKDTKNSGLFRKILNGTISPANLVRMTSEELASKELCEWREREEKKELQAIEKYELDMIALGNQYIMKSHKGEIEIDKDEFIKDKEKAPETLNSLPADPLTEVLEDTTSGHANHIYDLNCKICTGKQDPSYTRQDSKSYDEKSQEKPRRDKKEDKHKEPLKVKDRKERKSSSDKDKRERRESSDKERHKHRSKDTEKDKKSREERSKDKDKDRDYRDKDKIKSKDTNKDEHISDRDKDKSRVKHRNSKDGERERHKSISSNSNDKEKKDKERRDSRDKRDDQDRKHKDKHKDRRDSKGDKDRKRRDSEKSERKRKHSESRNDDRKRRESDKDISKRTDKDDDEKQKVEVSTSEDVVFDSYQMGKHFSSHTDCNTKDAEPTSTVVG